MICAEQVGGGYHIILMEIWIRTRSKLYESGSVPNFMDPDPFQTLWIRIKVLDFFKDLLVLNKLKM